MHWQAGLAGSAMQPWLWLGGSIAQSLQLLRQPHMQRVRLTQRGTQRTRPSWSHSMHGYLRRPVAGLQRPPGAPQRLPGALWKLRPPTMQL